MDDLDYRPIPFEGVHPLAVIENTPEIAQIAFTQNDIDAMISVFVSVGGCPINSRRKYIDHILEVLKPHQSRMNKTASDYQGSVWFAD